MMAIGGARLQVRCLVKVLYLVGSNDKYHSRDRSVTTSV
jgi:hypothetical protein